MLPARRNLKTELSSFDLSILTLVLFGGFIYESTRIYIENLRHKAPLDMSIFQDPVANFSMLGEQASLLLIGIIFLHFGSRFDWSALRWGIDVRNTLLGFFFFFLVAICGDGVSIILEPIWPVASDLAETARPESESPSLGVSASVSVVIYAMFNGLYEELFFLGLFLCVRPDRWWWALIASLVVRFSLHTYQGVDAALVITFMGLVSAVLYRNRKVLWPFIVMHALADVFGLGVIGYFI